MRRNDGLNAVVCHILLLSRMTERFEFITQVLQNKFFVLQELLRYIYIYDVCVYVCVYIDTYILFINIT